MCRNLDIKKIKRFESDFKQFMEITDFPLYQLTTKEVSLSVADSQGYDSVASAFYNFETNNHTLKVCSNLTLPKYVLFHEFTHILDTDMYTNRGRIAYAGLSGYTEYHASQIELMYLLGAKTTNEKITISVNAVIHTLSGEMSVIQYMREKQQHAIQLFRRDDFPANIDMLKSAFGLLYNYWGLRSICEMYALDYAEEIQNDAFLRFIPSIEFCPLNNMMHGWFDKQKIEKSICLYVKSLFSVIAKYNLS